MARFRGFLVLALTVSSSVASSPGRAGDPFRFPEARHGKGELKYRNGVPVLVVEGTPREIAEQAAALLGKPCARLQNYPKDVLSLLATPVGMKLLWPVVVKKGYQLLENFPADYREELETMVKATGYDRDLMVVANTAFDLKQDLGYLFGCSALIVEAGRSRSGKPFFGRNMDHFSVGYLHEYGLVTVCRPKGKHAFASVGFPGMIGCISGMNDAGLSLAVLETTGAPEGEGPVYNPEGVPFALCYRRLLEECTTVAEAEKALSAMKRVTTTNLVVCDRAASAVFEVTPTRVVVRHSEEGIGVCTNHFCTPQLKLPKPKNIFTTLDRYAALEKARPGDAKLGVEEVRQYLDRANQGELTMQTMVFEPATLTLHVAFMVGKQPASSQKLKTVELETLLAAKKVGGIP